MSAEKPFVKSEDVSEESNQAANSGGSAKKSVHVKVG